MRFKLAQRLLQPAPGRACQSVSNTERQAPGRPWEGSETFFFTSAISALGTARRLHGESGFAGIRFLLAPGVGLWRTWNNDGVLGKKEKPPSALPGNGTYRGLVSNSTPLQSFVLTVGPRVSHQIHTSTLALMHSSSHDTGSCGERGRAGRDTHKYQNAAHNLLYMSKN